MDWNSLKQKGIWKCVHKHGRINLGLITAIVASVYVNKKLGTEFKPIEFSGKMFDLLRSEEFKKTCMGIYEELNTKVNEAFMKEKISA